MTDISTWTLSTTSGAMICSGNKSAESVLTIHQADGSEMRVTYSQFTQMASAFGLVLSPMAKWERAIGHAIASGLRARTGEFIYQSAAIRMPEVPRDVLPQLFGTPTASSATELIYMFESASSAAEGFSSVMAKSDMQTAGASRSLQKPSEPVMRVIATMMGGAQVRHVTAGSGSEILYINFLYALITGEGELHPPKDSSRREMLLQEPEVAELRQTALSDVLMLTQQGVKVSPAWWRQLGDERMAQVTEAHMANLESLRQAAAASGGAVRVPARETYEIERVVGEKRGWVKVQWAGYHPSWEAWRTEGEGSVGDPVVSWERRKAVCNTIAYRTWTDLREETDEEETEEGAEET